MKKSELDQIIKEEIEAVINENILQKGFGKAYKYLKRKIKGKPAAKPSLNFYSKAASELKDQLTVGNREYIKMVLKNVEDLMAKKPDTVYLLHDAPVFQLLKNASKKHIDSMSFPDKQKANLFFKSTFTGNDRLKRSDITNLINLMDELHLRTLQEKLDTSKNI